MAEHGRRDDLALGRLDRLERGADGLPVDARRPACRTGAGRPGPISVRMRPGYEGRRRGVHVEAVAADEPDERQPGPAGGVHGERGRRADGDERAEAGGPRLLHHLHRRPAADEQPAAGGRQLAGRAAARRRPCRRRCGGRRPRGSAGSSPSRSNAAAACTAPVVGEQALAVEHPVGHGGEHRGVDRLGSAAAAPAGRAARRSGRCRTTRSSTTSCRAAASASAPARRSRR